MSEVENVQESADNEQFHFPPASFETLAGILISQTQFALMSYSTEEHKHEPDLPLARHLIDLLAVLEEKTKGNLSLEEQRLLGNSLTELRFRYVQAFEDSRKAAAGTESAQA
jgi:hypothetical protein